MHLSEMLIDLIRLHLSAASAAGSSWGEFYFPVDSGTKRCSKFHGVVEEACRSVTPRKVYGSCQDNQAICNHYVLPFFFLKFLNGNAEELRRDDIFVFCKWVISSQSIIDHYFQGEIPWMLVLLSLNSCLSVGTTQNVETQWTIIPAKFYLQTSKFL